MQFTKSSKCYSIDHVDSIYCKSLVLANTLYTPILHIIEDIKYYKSHLIHLWCDPYTETFKVPSFFFKQNVV